MNKKGFTLIELLAVIVILAIIALIATPIILGIINDAKSSAKDRSAENVYTGVEYGYVKTMYKGNYNPTLSDIKDNVEASIDNLAKTDGVTVADDAMTIKTADGVTCTVTAVDGGFKVTCDNPGKFERTMNADSVDVSTGGEPTPGA